MKNLSLFDIISPVMTGPSSSHMAGAVRLGLMARNIYFISPQKITFKLYNSFAQTGKGHGTDKGLLAGVLGYKIDSADIKNIFNTLEAKSLKYEYEFIEDFDRHPNAVDFIFEGEINMQISGNSTGGGNIEITYINEFATKISGEYNTLILFYKDKPGMISQVTSLIQKEKINIASLECGRNAKGELASMCICLDGMISKNIVDEISNFPDVYFTRSIKKLES